MISIQLDARELEGLEDAIGRLAKADRRTMLREIGADLVDREQERISEDKFDPDGQPWKPWADGYEGVSLLELTGEMRSGIKHAENSNVLQVFSTAPYARFHMTGTKKMPARPFLGWGPEELKIAEDAAVRTLREAFEA